MKSVFGRIVVGVIMLLFLISVQVLAAEEKSLELWLISTPVEGINDFYNEVAKSFEEKTGYKLEIVWVAREDMHTKIMTSVSAGIFPDLVVDILGQGVELSRLGVLRPVNDLVEEVGKEKFFSGILQMQQTPDGTYWALPIFSHPAAFHFRKDWLEEAGFSTEYEKDEQGNWHVWAIDTWDKVLEVAKKITTDIDGDGKTDRWGLGLQYARTGDTFGWVTHLIYSFGGYIYDYNEKRVAFNSPETIEAVQFISDLYNKYQVLPPEVTSWGEFENNLYIQHPEQAIVSMVINSYSIIPWCQKNAPEMVEKIGTAPYPKVRYRFRVEAGQAESLIIFKTDNTPIALEFAKMMMDKDLQLKGIQMSGGYWSPCRNDVLDDPYFIEEIPMELRMAMENDKYLISLGWPTSGMTPELAEVANSYILQDITTRVAVDKWSAEEAVAEATRAIEEIFEY
ncbi:MAG: multiple sugar transport system substrate-binding protein [Candidatus Atribacteria bacterium]|nr:multiple sugar transport system substrate-binding protein [Candidatus Atribacteria bacterium]